MDWDRIIDTYGTVFILYARQWVSCHADAEDVVQSAIVNLCKSLQPEREIPISWIYRAIRHRALDQIKSKKRRAAREETAADILYEQRMFEPVTGETLSDEVERALSKLPEDQKEVVIMKVWGDLTFREIAEALDVPANTAASRYRYAMDRLRTELGMMLISEREINGALICWKTT